MGLIVVTGIAMAGPDVIEPGIVDPPFEEPKVAEEVVPDDPRALGTVAEVEYTDGICVEAELRPDDVPFDARKVADADDPVLSLLWTTGFEPVDDKDAAASWAESGAELPELVFAFGPGARDDAELVETVTAL